MARTRGASFHLDDGVLVDKEGQPLPVEAMRSPEAALEALNRDPELAPPPEPPKPATYLCDRTTWGRSMDGYEAMLLLEALLGKPFSLKLNEDEFNRLNPNARVHFRMVR